MTLMEFLGEMTSCTLDAVSMAPHRCPGSVTTASTRHAVMSNSFMNNHNAQLTVKPPSEWNINYLRQRGYDCVHRSVCIWDRLLLRLDRRYWDAEVECNLRSDIWHFGHVNRSFYLLTYLLTFDCDPVPHVQFISCRTVAKHMIWSDMIWSDLIYTHI